MNQQQGKPVYRSPFDISLADSCRTNSGILSHSASERHRSISISSREPDFRAVIFYSGRLDQNTTAQQLALCYESQVNMYKKNSFRPRISK